MDMSIKTQHNGAAEALEEMHGEPEHWRTVNDQLTRSLRNAAELEALPQEIAGQERAANEAEAIRRHEALK
jgi:hypothetical protein